MRTASVAAATMVAASVAMLPAQEPNFGRALASDSTTLAVGQPVNWYGPGTVYLFSADPSGRLVERQRLVASDPARMDDFGRALALAGNTLVVGAPRKEEGRGVVYVFERSGGEAAWREMARLTAPAGGEFGAAVALEGSDLFISSPSKGTVHYYRQVGGSWQSLGTLQPDGALLPSFGATLALHDGRLLIGAPNADSGRGMVFSARRNAAGSWSTPTAVAIQVPGSARAGTALLIDGERAWVGAPGAGSAFMLIAYDEGWRADTSLSAPADLTRRANAANSGWARPEPMVAMVR
jgi:hypothetical protein